MQRSNPGGKLTLTPSRLLDYRIAGELGVNPDTLDELITARQTNEYREYFLWQDERRDKTDYYFAQLAGYASQKPRFSPKEFFAPSSLDRTGHSRKVSATDAAKIMSARYGKA